MANYKVVHWTAALMIENRDPRILQVLDEEHFESLTDWLGEHFGPYEDISELLAAIQGYLADCDAKDGNLNAFIRFTNGTLLICNHTALAQILLEHVQHGGKDGYYN